MMSLSWGAFLQAEKQENNDYKELNDLHKELKKLNEFYDDLMVHHIKLGNAVIEGKADKEVILKLYQVNYYKQFLKAKDVHDMANRLSGKTAKYLDTYRALKESKWFPKRIRKNYLKRKLEKLKARIKEKIGEIGGDILGIKPPQEISSLERAFKKGMRLVEEEVKEPAYESLSKTSGI